ncbi:MULTISPECIES: transcriptional repressor [Archaeoglobus]|uniref:Ferric uptake regulation protein homolog n=3 Tax=Archaeoglobus fulgidus TaxID=2234 RepID=FURH_ARCFU|nr:MULTISPECIES: transcriptional repressor [Archaeoglobus]O28051.1 RecName: Full=Ferric uptake regulation protein homolog [Archaeoglobus fulgidus DSM 4304]AAB89023.1 ferric uptake regulation protein (fur) [Archaeoglobus fulgidus DSM 4304]AIG99239.1 Fe2+/Zn2+ uptake regulation protein [Archaeoglobus fulgidus DSM 8774]KUJ93635.1 MAG: Ferric uptake regulation protein-like protein [Archaeoglobus fulgidus]KUK06022.1 MAG: Ferric uptake regulation protein-like protein [Archaeoglobus fulgidus]MDI3497
MWKERAMEEMKKAGLRLTPQRLKLIEVIEKIGGRHPTLKEVYEEVVKEFPTMSFSTLYSNLLIFRGLGLLDFFTLEGETRVEVNCEPHFNVIEREEIRDFVDEELIGEIERRLGRNVKVVNVFMEDRD